MSENNKPQPDRFLTVVYKVPADVAASVAQECCESRHFSASSWSHALDERDEARFRASQTNAGSIATTASEFLKSVGELSIDIDETTTAALTAFDRTRSRLQNSLAATADVSTAGGTTASEKDRAGWFVFEGNCWVATSSDDPRATKLYRAPIEEQSPPVSQTLPQGWSAEFDKYAAPGTIRVQSEKWGGCFLMAPEPGSGDISLPAIMYHYFKDAISEVPTSDVQGEALDAARWRAMLNSARIRMIGSAGLTQPQPNHYAHFGMEIWTRYGTSLNDEQRERMGKENAQGREWLTKYADIAIAGQQAVKPAGESQ